jgi:hypothetical protein
MQRADLASPVLFNFLHLATEPLLKLLTHVPGAAVLVQTALCPTGLQ